MKELTEILENAREGTPQALARFNDGEVGIMKNHNFVAARGDQRGSPELQRSIRHAMLYEQVNYWKGYPCSTCFPKLRKYVEQWYNPDYEYNTLAVVNTNRNLWIFQEGLQIALKYKPVVWVSGNDQDLGGLEFKIIKHIICDLKDAWSSWIEIHEKLASFCSGLTEHTSFMFSIGPTSRVLVQLLFKSFPYHSFYDIGSTYDNITRNVWHKCHKGTLKSCEECN